MDSKKSKKDMLNATVIDKIEVSSNLLRLFVKPDEPYRPFLPGQYVALGLPEQSRNDVIVKRAYSIGSPAEGTEELEFFLQLLPEGELTSRFAELKPGDRLYAAPKVTGTFTLDRVPAESNVILVATGTGVAPFMSMVRTPSTWTQGRKITLIHGTRYEDELAYVAELQALQEKKCAFRYIPILSRPGVGWRGEWGWVQRLFSEGLIEPDPARDHVFLCGNPSMIEDMIALLQPRGYKVHTRRDPGNLHCEKFW